MESTARSRRKASVVGSSKESDCAGFLELLPATTYQPPSPRGRLVNHCYVGSQYVGILPTRDEIMTANSTRSRRSSSTSSTNTITSTASSADMDKRRFLDLVPENGDE
ncbi:hypothetical protein MMC09_002797 [Bachmanniomyces sp. S44760]|nr:hypothetical protein [Bachmanniomyces sp. S44760]